MMKPIIYICSFILLIVYISSCAKRRTKWGMQGHWEASGSRTFSGIDSNSNQRDTITKISGYLFVDRDGTGHFHINYVIDEYSTIMDGTRVKTKEPNEIIYKTIKSNFSGFDIEIYRGVNIINVNRLVTTETYGSFVLPDGTVVEFMLDAQVNKRDNEVTLFFLPLKSDESNVGLPYRWDFTRI